MKDRKLVVVLHSGALPGLGGIGGPLTTPTELPVEKIVKLLQQNIKVLECDPADRMNGKKRVELNVMNVKIPYSDIYNAKQRAEEYNKKLKELPRRSLEDLEKRLEAQEKAEAEAKAVNTEPVAPIQATHMPRGMVNPCIVNAVTLPNGDVVNVNTGVSLEDVATGKVTTEEVAIIQEKTGEEVADWMRAHPTDNAVTPNVDNDAIESETNEDVSTDSAENKDESDELVEEGVATPEAVNTEPVAPIQATIPQNNQQGGNNQNQGHSKKNKNKNK